MASLFTKIIQGEIPAHKIAENENFFAFLDVFPLVKGHTLIIPKLETDYLFDIEDVLFQQLFLFAKQIAIPLKQAIPCKKIGITVIGLEVPHAHIHLIPMQTMSDMDFNKTKKRAEDTELATIAQEIRKFIF